jgi:GNAT superfamily N-acetyltransferase
VNLVTATAEVRPASDADLAALVAVLGERHWFTDRLARQQRGGGVLLVAWLDGRPVGEVFLECEPANEPEVRRQLPGVPRLDHLEVLGPLWGQGIGTDLIRAAEAAPASSGTSGSRWAWAWTTPRLGGCMSGSAMSTGAMEPWSGPGWSTPMMDHR